MSKKYGPIFQAASVSLMAFQSFVAPIFLGLQSFGQQIILLSSVFLAQSIFEPIIQTICNRSALRDEKILNLSDILIGAFISCFAYAVAAFISGAESFNWPLLTLLLVLYLANTFLAAFSFSENAIAIVALSSFGLFIAYLVGFIISNQYFPGMELILGLTFGMTVSSGLFAIYWARNKWGRIVRLAPTNYGEILNGTTFRLPTVVLTAVNIPLLSWLGFSATVIGQYKIFVSAIMAGRYCNLVPLPQAQMYLQRACTQGLGKETSEALLSYILSFGVFVIIATLSFPLLFDYVFEDRHFSRMALLLSFGAILVQPAAYAVLASSGQNNASITIISLIACALLGGFFILITLILDDPFIATGPSVIITLLFYTVNLRHLKRCTTS